MTAELLLVLVVLLPLAGAVLNGLFGWRHGPRVAGVVACGAVFLAFVCAVGAIRHLASLPEHARHLHAHLYTWIDASSFKVDMAFVLDPLSAVMILVVTGVGFLIHVYSVGYMAHDPGRVRYFTYLNLFVFFMLTLVLGASLPVMFLGWEGVGLCSYLLIGFWFDDLAKAVAGKKAFIVNRVGDMFFVLGMFALFWATHNPNGSGLDFAYLKANVGMLATASLGGIPIPALAAFCLFVGATGKSAQIPLYIWLPDAMAGPTPVSALIHAATMVTAGVYMVARMSFLFHLTPGVMAVVAWVGALTALFAALIGLAANDIKKVLAYSTISQLGYMFVGVGVGAHVAGIFHLVTHAFFKGLLFLGSGSVIHAVQHAVHENVDPQDIRKMGGLRARLPWTFWTFFAGTWAIAGLPPFSGFVSKDEILGAAFASERGSLGLWLVGVVTAALTTFYMFRLFALVFLGQTRMGRKEFEHVHESPRSMTLPLAILAVLAAVGGVLNLPAVVAHGLHLPQFLHHWLQPAVTTVEVHASTSTELGLMAVSVLAALGGTFAALKLYLGWARVPVPDTAKVALPVQMARDKFYVDEFYEGLVVLPMEASARLLAGPVDAGLVDRAIAALPPAFAGWLSGLVGAFQNGNTQRYAVTLFCGALGLLVYVTLYVLP